MLGVKLYAAPQDYKRRIGVVLVQVGDSGLRSDEHIIRAVADDEPVGFNILEGRETFYLTPEEARQWLLELSRAISKLRA